ncbi:MAG: hypothetical protein JW934_00745 [Anaerolineae bacterium]|nr:hypothetical protein [Anaerolineae bacterium]
MRKTRRTPRLALSTFLLTLILLACINIDPDPDPDPLPTPLPTAESAANITPPPQIEIKVQYYNKVPTAIYHLLGKTTKQQNFATFTLANRGTTAAKLKLVSEIAGFTDQAIDTHDLAPGETVAIQQTPIMKAGARDQLNEGQVASFHYIVTYLQDGTEKLVEEQSISVDMMSKRDLVVVIVDENGNLVGDFREYVAAWVTPASPAIEKLLRDATQYMPGEAIYGYQGGEEGVLPQLAAIYRVLNDDYQIRYVSTPVSLASTEKTFVQRVRLPAETIQQRAGNCIETAALYAAAIEAMDMNPLLVIVPGHAFVASETNDGSHQYIFVETTVLGAGLTFEDALRLGAENWAKYQSESMLIDIHHWRTKGILPMPEN